MPVEASAQVTRIAWLSVAVLIAGTEGRLLVVKVVAAPGRSAAGTGAPAANGVGGVVERGLGDPVGAEQELLGQRAGRVLPGGQRAGRQHRPVDRSTMLAGVCGAREPAATA